jgi:hypothetical protein
MELIPVDSSNVRSIGYAAEYRLLRVVFRDDSQYDYPDVSPEQHQALMASESKGRFIRDHLAKRGFRCGVAPFVTSGDAAATSQTASADPHARTGDAGSRLQTYEPDDCCPIAKAIESGRLDAADSWMCPKCGMEWRAETGEAIKHWSPKPVIVIF